MLDYIYLEFRGKSFETSVSFDSARERVGRFIDRKPLFAQKDLNKIILFILAEIPV